MMFLTRNAKETPTAKPREAFYGSFASLRGGETFLRVPAQREVVA